MRIVDYDTWKCTSPEPTEYEERLAEFTESYVDERLDDLRTIFEANSWELSDEDESVLIPQFEREAEAIFKAEWKREQDDLVLARYSREEDFCLGV